MSGPPRHVPTRAMLTIRDLGGSNGWFWYLHHGPNLIASSAGNGYLATQDEAMQHFEKFKRLFANAEVVA